jgi:tRNA(Ile)-lysidine synthase
VLTPNATDAGRATLTPAQVARFRVDTLALTGRVPGSMGLAVSGGGDSLAMLLLADAAFPGQVEVATVDHRLRPAAADEAAFVAALCAQRGIAHATLAVEVPKQANVSDAARQVRYAALSEWRESRGLDWIATAHHADDQLETLVMRLNRASGLAGLAGIRAINGRVIRPLLGLRRAELTEILNAAGIEPIADPSNSDDRYDRARVRKQLAESDLLDALAVARSAALLGEAEAALNAAIDVLADGISYGTDWAAFDPARLAPELRRRLLGRCLVHVDPGSAPRGSAVARAAAALNEGRRVSIGDALVQVAKLRGGGIIWRVGRAPARRT